MISKNPYNFSAAAPDEDIVHGACRPGHPRSPDDSGVAEWMEFMSNQGIVRVCCLLASELNRYDDLLGKYRAQFGDDRVCHAPTRDFSRVEPQHFVETIYPFLESAVASEEPVTVHCSAGSGRTGQVLVLWLVLGRGYDLESAITTVRATGRQPLEAVGISDLRETLEVIEQEYR